MNNSINIFIRRMSQGGNSENNMMVKPSADALNVEIHVKSPAQETPKNYLETSN